MFSNSKFLVWSLNSKFKVLIGWIFCFYKLFFPILKSLLTLIYNKIPAYHHLTKLTKSQNQWIKLPVYTEESILYIIIYIWLNTINTQSNSKTWNFHQKLNINLIFIKINPILTPYPKTSFSIAWPCWCK